MTEQPWNQHPSAYRPTPRNGDPFEVPIPEGAKSTDVYDSGPPLHFRSYGVDAPEGWKKVKPRWKPSPVQAISAAAALLALLVGIVVGQATASPSAPSECEVALDYAEEALGYSAEGMGVLGDALGSGYSALGRVSPKLDKLTGELERITPLYQDARSQCLA